MKILIPIAGKDEDFLKEFGTSKYMTSVGGKTLLEIFFDNFKIVNSEYIFFCKKEDLIKTNIISLIKSLNVKYKIIPIEKDTSSILDTLKNGIYILKPNDEIIIVHPDSINIPYKNNNFSSILKKFKKIDAGLCCYEENAASNTADVNTGRVVIQNKLVREIIEKSPKVPFSKILAGIYYFKKWKDLLYFINQTIKKQKPVVGRYFVSQIFNEYLRDKKKVSFELLNKHISLGLVKYVKEYNFWHSYFLVNSKIQYKIKFNFLNLIPACGEGKRFSDIKKSDFKPLIKIGGKQLINLSISSLPNSNNQVVIIRNDHNKKYNFKKKILKEGKKIKIELLDNKTDGMSSTCYQYLKKIKNNPPLIISSCDYTFVYDEKRLYNIINSLNPDVIIWTFKEYPDPRLAPFNYAYVKTLNGKVVAVSEKSPISKNPHKDEIVQGVFYFKSKKIFMAATKHMFKNKITVNNEYYVGNSINYLIKEKYNVITFQVDQYICLGTPHDIEVYKFWEQEFV